MDTSTIITCLRWLLDGGDGAKKADISVYCVSFCSRLLVFRRVPEAFSRNARKLYTTFHSVIIFSHTFTRAKRRHGFIREIQTCSQNHFFTRVVRMLEQKHDGHISLAFTPTYTTANTIIMMFRARLCVLGTPKHVLDYEV